MNLYHKQLNRKGFTLAELLVVVAILAILVAVSIPIFTGRLEAARETTDVANLRAAKAAAAEALLGEKYKDETVWLPLKDEDGNGNGDYRAIYDAEAGKLVKENRKEAYGKGTTSDGGIRYGGYVNTESYQKSMIYVTITEGDDQVDVQWYKAKQ